MQRFLKIILFVCCFGFSKQNFSQDIRAGWIEYKWVSGYTYSITVNLIVDSAFEASRPTMLVNSCFPLLPPFNLSPNTTSGKYKINKYSEVRTFGGPGICNIYIDEYLRVASIKNIFNSHFESMYIQDLININAFMGPNTSPALTSPPILQATLGTQVLYNPGMYDIDGDSLSYELANCTTTTYYMPANCSLNNAGTFSYQADTLGLYAFKYLIKEWRKDLDGNFQLMGETEMDFIVDVIATVGIKEFDKKQIINIYPNPTSNILNIKTNSKTNSEIEIINSLGQTVLKQKYSESVDVSKLNPGYYFIKVDNSYSKFIKE